MKQITATDAAKEFHHFLGLAEHGHSVQIRKHRRVVARLVPDSDFMSGREFSKLFADYIATALDKAAADDIEASIKKLDEEFSRELDHRHGHSH